MSKCPTCQHERKAFATTGRCIWISHPRLTVHDFTTVKCDHLCPVDLPPAIEEALREIAVDNL